MSNIRSLGDLNKDTNNQSNHQASIGSEDEDAQQFYAGGEKSGVAVQGPPKKPTHLIKDILGKAARGSQQQRDDEASQEKKPAAFTGAGYRLGSEDEHGASSSSTTTPPPLSSQQAPEELDHVERRLTFWADGFTVEDGPLMRYGDPANEEALQAINSGRAPIHILNVQPDQQVDVRVDHRMKEPWSEAAAKAASSASGKKPSAASGVKAFSGAGNRLGDPSESSSSSSSGGVPGSFPLGGNDASFSPLSAAPAPLSLTIDPSQPVTSIQIRLADGTRMVARMNHTHTVGDLRRFINASRPGEGTREYAIMTTFPNRDLAEEGITLKEAGLVNAVVVQRML
ncbi:ubiquitin-related domain-containing protein [Chytriomyces sp. MP71]|nr:ubiquitin-related domain-containing protein [Chytriomyces sp. MP71]